MDFGGTSTDLLLRLMSASSLRSRVISGNLANQNTPGYQRKAVRFEELLAEQMREGASPEQLARIQPEVEVDATREASPDGNSVDLEQEMNAMRENRLLYELYATMLTAKNRLIEAAIGQR
jgi:flagellar basal-body rod protein FlgB